MFNLLNTICGLVSLGSLLIILSIIIDDSYSFGVMSFFSVVLLASILIPYPEIFSYFNNYYYLFGLILYPLIGFLVSILKYKMVLSKEGYENYLKPDQIKDKISCWIIFWPFILLASFFQDFVYKLYTGSFNKFKRVFEKIYEKGKKTP